MCSKVVEGVWKYVICIVQSYVRTMEGGGGVIYK